MQEEQRFEPAETLEIRDLDALKVIADSGRMQIVDLLRRRAATVKEIATFVGVSPKSLYYHVNLLERHGLVQVVDTRLVSGILEKRYRATAYLFTFDEVDATAGRSPEQRAYEVVSSRFAITRDEIRVALESGMASPDEDAPPSTRLSVRWVLLDLSPAESEELGERMDALIEEYRAERSVSAEARPYRLLFSLFPTYRRGERPGPAPGRALEDTP